MEYKDLVAIVLTGVTVILAVFGIFLAILAVAGYRYLKEFVRTSAIEQIRDPETGEIRKDVIDAIDKYMFRETRRSEDLSEEDNNTDGR